MPLVVSARGTPMQRWGCVFAGLDARCLDCLINSGINSDHLRPILRTHRYRRSSIRSSFGDGRFSVLHVLQHQTPTCTSVAIQGRGMCRRRSKLASTLPILPHWWLFGREDDVGVGWQRVAVTGWNKGNIIELPSSPDSSAAS